VIPTSNQDGHQAKNRKKGDDIFKSSALLTDGQKVMPIAHMA
jgi:hypothetical protein